MHVGIVKAPRSHLVEDDGHDEEVQQEALGGVRTVEVEKDEREEQSEELEAGVAEGRAQELQSGDGRQENVTAGRQRGEFRRHTHAAEKQM